MKRLRSTGDGLTLVKEDSKEPPTLAADMKVKIDSIRAKFPHWATYEDPIQKALILIEFALEMIPQDWSSDLGRVKILLLLFDDDVRAHEAGA